MLFLSLVEGFMLVLHTCAALSESWKEEVGEAGFSRAGGRKALMANGSVVWSDALVELSCSSGVHSLSGFWWILRGMVFRESILLRCCCRGSASVMGIPS